MSDLTTDQNLRIGKLAPFARRAGLAVTGREKLARMASKLEFVIVTTDATDNTADEIAHSVHCPLLRVLTSEELHRLFGLENCRVAGFKKSSLSAQMHAIFTTTTGHE